MTSPDLPNWARTESNPQPLLCQGCGAERNFHNPCACSSIDVSYDVGVSGATSRYLSYTKPFAHQHHHQQHHHQHPHHQQLHQHQQRSPLHQPTAGSDFSQLPATAHLATPVTPHRQAQTSPHPTPRHQTSPHPTSHHQTSPHPSSHHQLSPHPASHHQASSHSALHYPEQRHLASSFAVVQQPYHQYHLPSPGFPPAHRQPPVLLAPADFHAPATPGDPVPFVSQRRAYTTAYPLYHPDACHPFDVVGYHPVYDEGLSGYTVSHELPPPYSSRSSFVHHSKLTRATEPPRPTSAGCGSIMSHHDDETVGVFHVQYESPGGAHISPLREKLPFVATESSDCESSLHRTTPSPEMPMLSESPYQEPAPPPLPASSPPLLPQHMIESTSSDVITIMHRSDDFAGGITSTPCAARNRDHCHHYHHHHHHHQGEEKSSGDGKEAESTVNGDLVQEKYEEHSSKSDLGIVTSNNEKNNKLVHSDLTQLEQKRDNLHNMTPLYGQPAWWGDASPQEIEDTSTRPELVECPRPVYMEIPQRDGDEIKSPTTPHSPPERDSSCNSAGSASTAFMVDFGTSDSINKPLSHFLPNKVRKSFKSRQTERSKETSERPSSSLGMRGSGYSSDGCHSNMSSDAEDGYHAHKERSRSSAKFHDNKRRPKSRGAIAERVTAQPPVSPVPRPKSRGALPESTSLRLEQSPLSIKTLRRSLQEGKSMPRHSITAAERRSMGGKSPVRKSVSLSMAATAAGVTCTEKATFLMSKLLGENKKQVDNWSVLSVKRQTSDNASETGTYTIDEDEVTEERQKIDDIFGVSDSETSRNAGQSCTDDEVDPCIMTETLTASRVQELSPTLPLTEKSSVSSPTDSILSSEYYGGKDQLKLSSEIKNASRLCQSDSNRYPGAHEIQRKQETFSKVHSSKPHRVLPAPPPESQFLKREPAKSKLSGRETRESDSENESSNALRRLESSLKTQRVPARERTYITQRSRRASRTGESDQESETGSVLSSCSSYISPSASPVATRKYSQASPRAVTSTRTNRAFDLRRARADGLDQPPNERSRSSSNTRNSSLSLKPTGRPNSSTRQQRPGTLSGRQSNLVRSRTNGPGRLDSQSSFESDSHYDSRIRTDERCKSAGPLLRDDSKRSSLHSKKRPTTPQSTRETRKLDLRPSSPKTAEYQAWQRRKQYDPRRAVQDSRSRSRSANPDEQANSLPSGNNRADRDRVRVASKAVAQSLATMSRSMGPGVDMDQQTYNSVLVSSCLQLSQQIKAHTKCIMCQLDVAYEPETPLSCVTDDLSTLLQNLRVAEKHLALMKSELHCEGLQPDLPPDDDPHYQHEMEQIRNEISSFRPIDKPLQAWQGDVNPLSGQEYY